jgi:hypothetical protein
VFATFNETPSRLAKLVVGTVSILAAVLAAIQTFLSYGQLTERHRTAAARYASSRRTIEVALTRHDAAAVDRIRVEMDKVGADRRRSATRSGRRRSQWPRTRSRGGAAASWISMQ